MIALFIGFKLGGFIGLLLAVPAAVVVISLAEGLQQDYNDGGMLSTTTDRPKLNNNDRLKAAHTMEKNIDQ